MDADDSNAKRFHVGSTIAGRYRVERPIGEGAMGAVALARHVSLDETVAIKFLRPELRRDPIANARLSREAKALARIKSDHVARVLDVGTTLSVGPYMVMEYLEGTDLGEVLDNEGPLPVARAVECVLQVCEALTVAHTAGITHRDIKPQNLFLARHGRFETLKILDFGIAEDAPPPESRSAPASVDGEPPARVLAPVYGTPPYMAPERVRNDADADHRSDIWSVGVVLHELVTGRAVFDAPTITETCARIVSNEPLGLERDDAVLPPAVRNIIARCLERDPARRYQCVEELAAALAPLATMHERFRGRSTGAFSRRLIEEELAQQARSPAPASARPTLWQPATAALGRSAWLRRQGGLKYVLLAVASALVVGLGARALGGVRWMQPPPRVAPSIRGEPAALRGEPARSEPSRGRSPDDLRTTVQSVLPVAPPAASASVSPAPEAAGSPASSASRAPEAAGSLAPALPAAEDATPSLPAPPLADAEGVAPRAASKQRRVVGEGGVNRQAAASITPSAPAREPDAAVGSDASAGGERGSRSRVHLVPQRQEEPADVPLAAESSKKERARKARLLPSALRVHDPKAP